MRKTVQALASKGLTTILSLTMIVPVQVHAQTAAYDFSYWEKPQYDLSFSEDDKVKKAQFQIKEETAPIFKQKGSQLGLLECGSIVAGKSDTERRQQRTFWIQVMHEQNPELNTNNESDRAVFLNAYKEEINFCLKMLNR
jgi:hypothetical protein